MLDAGEVRKRLRHTIDAVRREAAARRTAAVEAQRDFEHFLESTAAPVLRHLAAALRAEGLPFQVFTPAGSVRLASERSKEDFLEIVLDPTRDPPAAVGRVSVTRGSRITTSEQPVKEGTAVRDLTGEDLLAHALRAIGPFVER